MSKRVDISSIGKLAAGRLLHVQAADGVIKALMHFSDDVFNDRVQALVAQIQLEIEAQVEAQVPSLRLHRDGTGG